jgi:hypothetical protein
MEFTHAWKFMGIGGPVVLILSDAMGCGEMGLWEVVFEGPVFCLFGHFLS